MTPYSRDLFCEVVQKALERIDSAVAAVEQCHGKLGPEEYKALRMRSGHLMDTLYRVGDTLCKAT
jgi:hypothetical protein